MSHDNLSDYKSMPYTPCFVKGARWLLRPGQAENFCIWKNNEKAAERQTLRRMVHKNERKTVKALTNKKYNDKMTCYVTH